MILTDDDDLEMVRSGSDLQPMRHGLQQSDVCPSTSTVPESLTVTSRIAEQCVDLTRERY